MTYEQALKYIRKWTPQGVPKQWLKALDIVRFHRMGEHDEELNHNELKAKVIEQKTESRPKSKWVRRHYIYEKCDFCGFGWGSNEGRKFNYCPNCGADMRGNGE